MLKVGITGGMGSGKTTVCKIFESLGISVYYADDRGKSLMAENETVRNQLIEIFGEDAFAGGKLQRAFIAQIAFNDPVKLKELESIVHPAVQDDFGKWVEYQKSPYVLKEAALLYESGSHLTLDKIIVVHAGEETRINRVIRRNNIPREEVNTRIKYQIEQEEKKNRADFLIKNDNGDELIPQIMKIDQILRAQIQ